MEKAHRQQKKKEESLKDIHAKNRAQNLEGGLTAPSVSPLKASKKGKGNGFVRQEMSVKDIEARLSLTSESLCLALLGEPNRKLSNKNNFRYGAKGSLSINLSKGLWKNFETDEAGNNLGLIKSALNLNNFKDVIAFAKNFLGGDQVITPTVQQTKIEKNVQEAQEQIKKKEKVLEIVNRSRSIKGTLAETYLKQTRGLSHFDEADIRFIEKQETYHGKKKTYAPALVAIARDEKGDVHHIEVIKLNSNNAKKDEKSDPIKQSFGSKDGYYVELNKAYKKEKTYLAEGVETGLSLVSIDKNARVVAVLGKGNFMTIKHHNLGKEVVFCVDNDGKKTHNNSLIIDAIDRLEKAGKNVSVIMPKKEGHDLNDVLIKEGKEALKSVIKNEITASEFKKMHDQYLANSIRNSNTNAAEITPKNTSILPIEKQISQERVNDFIRQEVTNLTKQRVRNLEREL